jgi:hypothetical protein
MEFKEIDRLINKYFEGESSLKEEIMIRKFLIDTDPLPENYERLKAMFLFFDSEAQNQSHLKMEELIPVKRKQRKLRQIFYLAAAASIAIVFGIWALSHHDDEKKVYAYINGKPIENREMAYKEAQKALLLVSKNLNKGTEKIHHLSEFDKAISILNKE